MDWNTLRNTAKEKFRGACRVCPVCNGAVCAGEVPGMGGLGTGSGFKHNVQALAEIKLNLRTVHDISQPKLSTKILGMELALPVICAPIGGLRLNMNGAISEEDYNTAVVTGCARAGIISMTADGPMPEIFDCGLKALLTESGRGIPVIKPRESHKIIEMAQRAADAGAPAFGVDIDAASLINMTNAGQRVGPKNKAELEYIKNYTTIPFIVKGVMTPDEAKACYAAGADAIVVSNHGGRALDYAPGTAEVLPYIAEAVKGEITILVDGGIHTGADILKMLALGADAVLIGRYLAIAAVGGGSDGVVFAINKLAAELRAAMVLTGTADVADVPETIIWQHKRR